MKTLNGAIGFLLLDIVIALSFIDVLVNGIHRLSFVILFVAGSVLIAGLIVEKYAPYYGTFDPPV